MSLEDARLLIERITTDEVFREKVMATPDTAERLRLVRAEGYDVTEADIESAAQELGDAELDLVAGTGFCGWGRECSEVFPV